MREFGATLHRSRNKIIEKTYQYIQNHCGPLPLYLRARQASRLARTAAGHKTCNRGCGRFDSHNR